MKRIIIIAEVPDDFPEEMSIYSCEINGREDKKYHEYDRFHSCDDAKIFTLPSAWEIDLQFPTFDEHPKENIYRAEGANWFKSLITKP